VRVWRWAPEGLGAPAPATAEGMAASTGHRRLVAIAGLAALGAGAAAAFWLSVGWQPAPPAAIATAAPTGSGAPTLAAIATPPLPDKPSVAVLPFSNHSGEPEQAYFADGVADDILTALSRFPSLFVIARNSSFSYRGKAIDVRQVGRELGVRYVLE